MSALANVRSEWVNGDLYWYDKTGAEIFHIDGTNGNVFFGAGMGKVAGARKQVNMAAATATLTVAQSGQRFAAAVDAVFTLPAAGADTKGVWYEFECGALSAGTGLSISPAAADHIRGNGLTAVDDKDLINSGASDRLGDSVRLYCDGVDGWVIESIIGTWAKES